MPFARNLIGAVVIMVVATVLGIVHNAVRSEPVKLFPKMATTPTTATPIASLPAGTPEISAEEFAVGELTMERVNTVLAAGAVMLVDARAESEYGEGHLTGAINIPYDSFVEYVGELEASVPMDAPVIVYCRSATCDLSDQLAREMKLMGYERVVVYRGGWDEWVEAGLSTVGGEGQ